METVNTWDNLLRVLQIGLILINTLAMIWLWRKTQDDSRHKNLADSMDRKAAVLEGRITAEQNRINEHHLQITGMDRRLAISEAIMQRAPTHNDLERMWNKLNEVGQAIAAVNERSRSTHDSVRSIQDHLLDGNQ